MKKFLSVILIISSLLALSACGGYYEPIKSTDEEARVIMTLSFEDKTYEVRYELYRAMFLTYKATVDGGDGGVWSGEGSEEYVARVHELIVERITDIYAALHLCDKIGINLYSNAVEKEIKEYVKTGVEGGIYDGEAVGGYSSYEEYLEALSKLGLNYSVQELVLRYAIAIDKITAYYAGEAGDEYFDSGLTGGAIEYTREDVEDFYYSYDSVRYMLAFVQSKYSGAYDRALRLREKMLSAEGNDAAVATAIISSSISAGEDVMRGVVIGKYSLDEENYRDMTKAAFETNIGKVSEIVEVTAGKDPGYYILYPVLKSEEHFEECYDEIAAVYVENEIGKLLYDVQTALTESARGTELLDTLDYSKITYPKVAIEN